MASTTPAAPRAEDEDQVQTLRNAAVQRQNAQPQDEEDQLKGSALQREGDEKEE